MVILTGPIRSGKTTCLEQWCRARIAAADDVDGILAPTVNGTRYIQEIHGNRYQLDAAAGPDSPSDGPDAPSAGLIRIGPHAFRKDAFLKAQDYLLQAYDRLQSAGFLVIDEIGPLELRGEGLEPAVSRLFAVAKTGNARIVLVVREGLVQRICERYDLEATVIRPDELPRS